MHLSKLTSAELRDGKFVLGFNPAAEAPSAKEEADEMANKAKQFAALGAVILILTMILLFIVISRWRKSRITQ
jgi:peroxiredoxin